MHSGPTPDLDKGVRNVTSGKPTPAPQTFSATSVDAAPGQVIEYRLTYRNTGTGPATNVKIFDEVPATSTFKQCSDGCTHAAGGAAGTEVSWTVASVPVNGTVVRTFQTTLDSTFTQNEVTIPNTASVTDDEGSSTDSNTTSVVVAAPHVPGLVKAAENLSRSSGPAQPGDRIRYTLTYTNSGSGPATNVSMFDEVPSRTTFEECSDDCARVPAGGTAPGTEVRWTAGTVDAGQIVARSFTVRLDSSFPAGNPQVCNVGTATDQGGPTDSNQVCFAVTAAPNLTLSKAAAAGGDTITFTITYANTGNGEATDVVISDPVPGSASFVSCSDNCTRTPANGTSPGTVVSWSFASVPGGSGGSVTLTVEVDAAGGCLLCNVAGITSDQTPTAVLSQPACVTVTPEDQAERAHARGMQGYVEIPSIGGHAHQGHEDAEVPQARAGLWATDSSGEIENAGDQASSSSSSWAQAADVCLLPADGTCTISAEAVRSQSNSSMSGTNSESPPQKGSNADGSFMAKLRVLGVPEVGDVEKEMTGNPDQEVVDLPYGFVVLNEQLPDAATTDGAHTSLTVRAIRVTITLAENPFDLPVGARIIVAEAYSGATWNWDEPASPDPPA